MSLDRAEMGQVSPPVTPFAELNDLLTEFVERATAILERNFVGANLTGSFALGAGDASSDCDFLVVTRGSLTSEQEAALRALHAEIPARPGYWPRNFEGSYAPRADLETLNALGRRWLYVNRGSPEMQWSEHCNTLDVRSVLRERSPHLAGEPARGFACEVPADILRRAMRSQIETCLEDMLSWARFDIMWSQRYAVEALCRMLYTLQTGQVTSKSAGLAWAREALPAAWRPLIDQVHADRLEPWDDPPRPGSVARSLAFVDYAREYARAFDRAIG